MNEEKIPVDPETEHTLALRRVVNENPDKVLATLSSGFLGVIHALDRLDTRLAEFIEAVREEGDDDDWPDDGDPTVGDPQPDPTVPLGV